MMKWLNLNMCVYVSPRSVSHQMCMNNVLIAGPVCVVFSQPSWQGHRGMHTYYVTVPGEVWVHVAFSSSISRANCLTTTMRPLRGPSARARSGDNYLNMKLSLLSLSLHLPLLIVCQAERDSLASGRDSNW